MITPNDMLKKLQDENRLTELMMMQEEIKTLPFGDIWAEYCTQCNVCADSGWYESVKKYETEVLANR